MSDFRIELNLGRLQRALEMMGAEPATSWESNGGLHEDFEPIEIQLQQGLEVNLDDVEANSGDLLTYEGRQVLLYIKDQSWRLQDAVDDPTRRPKFHVSDCRTLESMRENKRFDRYVVTTDCSGEFLLAGQDSDGLEFEATLSLNVCQNCLKKLNYRGSRFAAWGEVKKLAQNFDLDEFFATYRTLFTHIPRTRDTDAVGYSPDWEEVSRAYRQKAGWTCQKCRVDLKDHANLLHVHHRNGKKSDNRPENLQALCKACHAEQWGHRSIWVKPHERDLLRKLLSGGISHTTSWGETIALADPAVHGLLDVLSRNGGSPGPPVVGFEVSVRDKNDSFVELAWPNRNIAVALQNDAAVEALKKQGWEVLSVGEAMVRWTKT